MSWRVSNTPGVTSASAVSVLPMNEVGVASALPFSVEGRQPPATEDPLADVRIVAPGYFETMKIRLLEGRFLDGRDGVDGPRTSVINETMARRYFQDRSPLGQTIVNPHGKSVVVGVVGDVRNQGLRPKKQVICRCGGVADGRRRSSRERPAFALQSGAQGRSMPGSDLS
jgi:putative ABC transport system permease protein